jgi:hypothetical protein
LINNPAVPKNPLNSITIIILQNKNILGGYWFCIYCIGLNEEPWNVEISIKRYLWLHFQKSQTEETAHAYN